MLFMSAVNGITARSIIMMSTSLADVSGGDLVSGGDVAGQISNAGSGISFGVKEIIIIILAVFAIIMLLLELLRSRYVLTVSRRSIDLPELPSNFNGTKLVVLSDLHQMRFGDYNEELAKRIKREHPDYIFFVGDMGDAKKFDVDAFYDLLEALGNSIPILIVPGGDDLKLGGGKVHKNFVREIERAGAVMINNACAEMVSGDQKLYIYGFCQPLAAQEDVPVAKWHLADVSDADMLRLVGRCPKDAPVILLAHDPRPFGVYKQWGAKLVLSGHMHGGVIRLPGLGGLLSPDGGFRPQYSAGEYDEDGSVLYVTRGLGSSNSLRVFNPPEISVLTLHQPGMELPATPEVEKLPPRSLGEIFKEQFAMIGDWFRGESRSAGDLINERAIQTRDFFALLFGKKRSRFAIEADIRKRQNTYVAPKDYKRKKKNQDDTDE